MSNNQLRNKELYMKKKYYTMIILMLLNIIFIGCNATKSNTPTSISISITNNTEETIMGFYISRFEPENWSKNLLLSSVEAGASITVILPTHEPGNNYTYRPGDNYFLQVRSNTSGVYTKHDITLKDGNNTLTFTKNDLSVIAINIVNNTGVDISGCYVSRFTSTWGYNLLNPVLINGASRIVYLSQQTAPNNYSVQLRTSEGNTFTKENLYLSIGYQTLTFTSNDISSISIVIVNNTGINFDLGCFEIQTESNYNWDEILEFSRWTGTVLNPNESRAVYLNSSYTTGLYNLRLRYTLEASNHPTLTKREISLEIGNNSAISFTKSDSDGIAVEVINNIGVSIPLIRLRESGTSDWLGLGYIITGIESDLARIIYFNTNCGAGNYDISMWTTNYIGSKTYTKSNVPLNKGSNPNLIYTEADADDQIILEIVNNTGESVDMALARLNGTLDWLERDPLFYNYLPNANSQIIYFPVSFIAGNYDLQLRQLPNFINSYTKYNIPLNIGSNQSLIFTIEDKD